MADDTNDDEYEVGYRKPPKHAQFKPGQSGNPSGRPKDSRNIKQVLRDVSRENVDIKEDGCPMTVSKQEALIRSAMARALQGDNRAAKILIDLFLKHPGQMDRFHRDDDW